MPPSPLPQEHLISALIENLRRCLSRSDPKLMKGRSKLRPFCVSETFGPTHSEISRYRLQGLPLYPC